MLDRSVARIARWCLVLTAVVLSPSAAPAQDLEKPSYEIAFYVWGASVSGELATRAASAEIDATFSDILDQLNMGAFAVAQARWGRWVAGVDAMYIQLEEDTGNQTVLVNPGPGPGIQASTRVKAELEEAFVDVKAGYALLDAPLPGERGSDPRRYGLDLMVGARWWYVKPDIDVRLGPLSGGYESSESWVDGLVGLQGRVDLTPRLRLVASGDVGGFSIGSAADRTWRAMVTLRWQASERWNAYLAYRALYLERPVGERGELDLRLRGPLLGVGYAF